MDVSLLIYLVIFLIIIVLIFKLIKKVLAAVFVVFFFIIAIIAGIGVMTYFDYQSIVEKDNFDLNLIYGDLDNFEFGLSIKYKDDNFDTDSFSDLNVNNISKKYIKNQEDDFYVFISKDLFLDILDENQTYYLVNTKDLEFSGIEINTTLKKKDIIEILNSENADEEYVKIILENNDLKLFSDMRVEDIALKQIQKQLGDNNLKSVLLLSVLSDLDKDSTKKLILGFKEKELLIYPEKFSFKFLRLLPVNFLFDETKTK